MLNKKKVAAVIAIFIIIIGLFITIVGGKGTKVSKLYNKLNKKDAFMFEMKDENGSEITVAKKNNQTAIDMNNNGERVTTLVKNGEEFLISHAQKEYYAYNGSLEEETTVTDMLKELTKTDKKGKEKINDATYSFEEYEGFDGFMTSTNIDIENENVKTRFYFKGNELKYIKTIVENQEEELLEINISYQVPDEMFEIPSDYSETTY